MSKDIRRMERFLQRFKKWDKMGDLNEEDVQNLGKRDINEILVAIKSIVKARLSPLSNRYNLKLQIIGKVLETGIDAMFNLDFSDVNVTEQGDEAIDVELESQYRVLILLVKRLNKKLPDRMDFVDNWFTTHQSELELLTLSFGIAIKGIQLTINVIFSKK
ncbi:MAG: hypothetical protein ACTSRE_07285 [Promethearchaeota archaeon]